MYETYSYDQLKALPDDQKITALKELKTTYPDNKDLAKHLDVPFIGVNNMVAKYLEGKQMGRKKMTEEEKLQAKVERKLKKQQEEKMQQQLYQQNQVKNVTQEIKNEEKVNETTNLVGQEATKETQSIQPTQTIQTIISNSFSIKLEKNMTGEEAISRLSGVANSLLKENQYKVNLVIEEVGEV